MLIITSKSRSLGKTRSEQETNLQKDGWYSLTGEQLDKCRHVEKKMRDRFGSRENFVNQSLISKVR